MILCIRCCCPRSEVLPLNPPPPPFISPAHPCPPLPPYLLPLIGQFLPVPTTSPPTPPSSSPPPHRGPEVIALQYTMGPNSTFAKYRSSSAKPSPLISPPLPGVISLSVEPPPCKPPCQSPHHLVLEKPRKPPLQGGTLELHS